MTNIKKSRDYCPHCRRITEGLKDYELDEYLCLRCGRKSILNTINTIIPYVKPQKMAKSYMKWFNKRIL